MIRLTLVVLIHQAIAEMHSLEHGAHMSSQSKSYSLPTHSEYVYRKYNNKPGSVSNLEYNSDSALPFSKYGMTSSEDHFETPMFKYTDPEMSRTSFVDKIEITDYPLTNYAVDAAIAKAEANYDSKFLPSKMKSDAMYERLKSVMHYHPPDSTFETPIGYDMYNYHLDDEDIRTSSRGLYNSWPYFYQSPYEYEYMKIDSEIEKAKNKRYTINSISMQPVYRNAYDIPDSNEYAMIPSHVESVTDNLIRSNGPFFSLNKYPYDDLLTFKGIEWDKDFGYRPKVYETEEYKRKEQDLDNNFPKKLTMTVLPSSPDIINYNSNKVLDDTDTNYGDSIKENSYVKKNKFNTLKIGKDNLKNHKTAYENDKKMFKTFKDFTDSFASKYGEEDHKKDSKYILKMNQDKGEKKKGFRRVYHKDEYQEDNEFYDNNNNSAKAEESGSSKAHIGGSEAILQSNSAIAVGDVGTALNKAGSEEDKLFENKHKGHDFRKGTNNQFNRYKDVAKKSAQSNIADYKDHYRI